MFSQLERSVPIIGVRAITDCHSRSTDLDLMSFLDPVVQGVKKVKVNCCRGLQTSVPGTPHDALNHYKAYGYNSRLHPDRLTVGSPRATRS